MPQRRSRDWRRPQYGELRINRDSPQWDQLVAWMPAPWGIDAVRRTSLTSTNSAEMGLSPFAGRGYQAATTSTKYWLAPTLNLTVPFTIAVWALKLSNTSATNTAYSSNSVALTANRFGTSLQLAGAAAWSASYFDGQVSTVGAPSRRTASGVTLSINTLYHLVAVCRAAADWSLYVNGVPNTVTHSGSGGALSNSTFSGAVGATPDNAGIQVGNVVVPDVKAWSKALSDREAYALWDLATRWQLEESRTRVSVRVSAGRTARNTRAQPLGLNVGMGWRMPL